jgi:ABC-type dipeptide/oligopeptide/nickel transport system permease subunit
MPVSAVALPPVGVGVPPPRRRLLARLLGTPGAIIGCVILAIILLAALLAPVLAPYDWNATSVCRRIAPISAAHWFGCDQFGRDIFSRVIYGGRFSLAMGVSTVAISLVFGSVAGMAIGYAGGRVDAVGTRLIDAMLGFPPIVLAILVVSVLGVGMWDAALAVGIAGIPRFARITRGATLSLVQRDFLEAARAVGATGGRILGRHLLPNLAPVLIVIATLDLGNAVLFTATLSFLGLGAQPPTPEWGAMLNAGRDYVRYAPWTMVFPGLALFLGVMAVNLVGDRLSLILDPRQGGRR